MIFFLYLTEIWYTELAFELNRAVVARAHKAQVLLVVAPIPFSAIQKLGNKLQWNKVQ